MGDSEVGKRICGDVYLLKLNEMKSQPKAIQQTAQLHYPVFGDVPEGLEKLERDGLLQKILEIQQWKIRRSDDVVELVFFRMQEEMRGESVENLMVIPVGTLAKRIEFVTSSLTNSSTQEKQQAVALIERGSSEEKQSKTEQNKAEQSKAKRSREEEPEGEESGTAKRKKEDEEREARSVEQTTTEGEQTTTAPKRKGRGRGKKQLQYEKEKKEREEKDERERREQEKLATLGQVPEYGQRRPR